MKFEGQDWAPSRYTQPLSDDFDSDGPTLAQFANIAWTTPEQEDGFKLHEWQEALLTHALERYPKDYKDPELAGKLRYRQVVVSVVLANLFLRAGLELMTRSVLL